MKTSMKVLSLVALFGCVFSLSACGDKTDEIHEHTFSTGWEYDNYTHWHPATCEHDDIVSDIESHVFDGGHYEVEPTCNVEGIYVRTCTVCGYIQEENVGYSENGHAYISKYNDENHWQECTICGDIINLTGHSLVLDDDLSTIPTCVATGENIYVCTGCEYTKTEVVDIDSSNHNWVYNEEESTEATCGSSGVSHYYCTDCGQTYNLYQPATGEHTYSYHTWGSGHHRLVCDVCDASGGDIESCTYEVNEEASYAQTCGENGIIVYDPCPLCGSTKASETLFATEEHDVDYTQWVITDEGHWRTCSGCSQQIYYSSHHPDQYNNYNETEHWYKCAQCGYEAEHVSHNLVESHKDSTCVEYGYTKYDCSDCDYSLTVPYDYLADHEYDDGKVTTEPTCLDLGEMTYTCKVCGETYTETIAAKGHTYTEGEYEHTEDGHYQICVDCGTPTDLEHHVQSDVTRVDSTCTDDGYAKWTCETCGYEHEEVLPAGHTYDESSEVYIAPTCTEDGYASGTCLVCGETHEEVLPALGHDLIDGTTEIDENGHYQECSRCGELVHVSNHLYDSETDICTDCGYEFPWTYEVDNSTYEMTLTGRKSTSTYDVVVPSHYNAYTITTLGDGKNSLINIRTITLSETLTTIAANAFNGTSLNTINFAEDGCLSTIDTYAFKGCSLTRIDIPDSVTTIGDDSFQSCSKLTEVTIGAGVTYLGSGAFKQCTSLTDVVIGTTNLTAILFDTFNGDKALVSVNIPDSVVEIGASAFLDCNVLHEIVLPTSVTTLDGYSFGLLSSTSKSNGIQTIYYLGTAEDKANIDMGEEEPDVSIYINTIFTATWLYYSESQPTDNLDQYWHYDTTGNPVVWSI